MDPGIRWGDTVGGERCRARLFGQYAGMGPKTYIVYMLASRKNGTIYTGFSGDPLGRIWQHKHEWFEGFTKRYSVKRLVWYEFFDDAEAGIRREKQLKNWRRAWKVELLEQRNPDWRDLYAELGGEPD